ncbi:hypothetical protein ILYODFUR_018095 [Ilyodon furcidens]|uniref:Uncharacterized protein n=1 Tax=Ilyodon furcidens TaxID=33524 RepID=A0ABV0UAI0_9TELE
MLYVNIEMESSVEGKNAQETGNEKQGPFKSFGRDSQDMDCKWSQSFKSHHTDISRSWATAFTFLVSSHSCTRNIVRSLYLSLENLGWTVAQGFKIIFSDENLCCI